MDTIICKRPLPTAMRLLKLLQYKRPSASLIPFESYGLKMGAITLPGRLTPSQVEKWTSKLYTAERHMAFLDASDPSTVTEFITKMERLSIL